MVGLDLQSLVPKLANIAGQFLLHLKPGVVAAYCNLLQPASAPPV
jgi:hypothetical protein